MSPNKRVNSHWLYILLVCVPQRSTQQHGMSNLDIALYVEIWVCQLPSAILTVTLVNILDYYLQGPTCSQFHSYH